MIKTTIDKLKYSDTRILAEYFDDKKLIEGGLYMFKPGEKAHDEPQTHETAEVLIFIQGTGKIPINGVFHPLKTGDVVVVEAGEYHNTESSVENPLVVTWFSMEK
jgi:mannose-6-phosphate isomerase-like protein (cupin superfamily)